jgi:hypothetical protein
MIYSNKKNNLKWITSVFPRISAISLFFLLIGLMWGAGHNIDDEFSLIDYIICYGSISTSTIILVFGFGYCVAMTLKKNHKDDFLD